MLTLTLPKETIIRDMQLASVITARADRPDLKTVLFQAEPTMLRMVVSDTAVLCHAAYPIPETEPFRLCVDPKTVLNALKTVPNDSVNLEIHEDGLRINDQAIPKADHYYPNWERVVTRSKKRATLPRATLRLLAQCASTSAASPRMYMGMFLRIVPDAVIAEYRGDDYDHHEWHACWTGIKKQLLVRVNPRFLYEALDWLTSPLVTLEYTEPMRPLAFLDTQQDRYALVMPMQIQDNRAETRMNRVSS